MKKELILLLTIIYFAAQLFLLLNNAISYDDLTIYQQSYAGVMQGFASAGTSSLGNGYVYYFLNTLPNPIFIFKLLNFIFFFCSGMLLYFTLNNLSLQRFSFMITALFYALPYYDCRNTMICIFYSFDLFLFIFILFIISKANLTNALIILLVNLLAFYSFVTNSIILLYITVVPLVIFIRFGKLSHLLNTKYLLYFICVLVFLWFRSAFMHPTGLHALEGYNAIGLKGIVQLPLNLLRDVNHNLITLIILLANVLISYYLFLLLCIGMFMLIAYRSKPYINSEQPFQINLLKRTYHFNVNQMVLWVGFLLILLSITPYSLVGKGPSFNSFNTRNQLLLVFSAPIFITGLIYTLLRPFYAKAFLFVVILLCIITSNLRYINYQKNMFKQMSIVENAKTLADLDKYTSYLVNDNTPYIGEGALNSAHTYNALLKYATGKQDKIAISEDKYKSMNNDFGKLKDMLIDGEALSMKDWKPKPFEAKIIVTDGSIDITSLKNCLKLMYLNWTNKASFDKEIQNVVTLKIEPIVNS